jgi:hypothetical protein
MDWFLSFFMADVLDLVLQMIKGARPSLRLRIFRTESCIETTVGLLQKIRRLFWGEPEEQDSAPQIVFSPEAIWKIRMEIIRLASLIPQLDLIAVAMETELPWLLLNDIGSPEGIQELAAWLNFGVSTEGGIVLSGRPVADDIASQTFLSSVGRYALLVFLGGVLAKFSAEHLRRSEHYSQAKPSFGLTLEMRGPNEEVLARSWKEGRA